MKNRIIYFFVLTVLLQIACSKDEFPSGTVVDIEGNRYSTVIIGEQEWMAENLRTSKYRNGISIEKVTSDEIWATYTKGAYCIYNNETNVKSENGLLYNYHAIIDSNNIAPAGWHVSSRDDWEKLIEFYGGIDIAGEKLKNNKMFNLKYSGFRSYEGKYIYSGRSADWWCSPGTSSKRGHVSIFYIFDHIQIYNSTNEEEGLAIRCVKD